MAAPYGLTVNCSDDETLVFTVVFEMTDGDDFPFGDYEIEYLVKDEAGGERLNLSDTTTGVTVDAPYVTFMSDAGSLEVGRYTHGCRLRAIADDTLTMVFDGQVLVSEGTF